VPFETVTVATWNLRTAAAPSLRHAWPCRRPLAMRTLAAIDADVVALQEVRPSQLDALRHDQPGYEVVARCRRGTGRDEHLVVLVRKEALRVGSVEARWFSETPSVAGSKAWGTSFPRCALIVDLRDVAHGDGSPAVRVINVHLDHASRRARAQSLELLASWLSEAPDLPTVVLGDLNTGVDDEALAPLWDAGLVDAHAHLAAKGRGAGTFYGYRGTTSGRRIDAIFASQRWNVADASIRHDLDAARHASDHWPVTATLRRAE
jgi:endonuclease/exonuclease/phosphatase family metal-dependent hydrolase